MNLKTTKTIIYKASQNTVLSIVFNNPLEDTLLLNCSSSDTVFNSKDYIIEGDYIISDIQLGAGDTIVAWGDTAITYKLFDNNIEVKPLPIDDTSLAVLKTSLQSSVGLQVTTLTNTQVKDLLFALLWKEGGVDETGRIKKLNTWLK